MKMKPMAEKHRAKRERKFKKKKGAWAKEMGAVEVSDHAMERCAERGVTRQDIQHAIQYGEAKRLSKDKVVFRHHGKKVIVGTCPTHSKQKKSDKEKEKEMKTFKVVTVLTNSKDFCRVEK